MILSLSGKAKEREGEGKRIKERLNIHTCPSCREETLMGMPGGRDAVCKNCGFKEPCCED